MSPNQAIPNMPLEVDTPNVPDLPFSYEQKVKSSVKQVRVCIVNFVDLKEWYYSRIISFNRLSNKFIMILIFMVL